MIKVPLNDLKSNLAHWIGLANKGNQLLITKHNQPIAYLVPCQEPGVHTGTKALEQSLTPLFSEAKGARWLKFLSEDRDS